MIGRWELTNRDATVGATQVDVTLRDGGHAELVIGPGEECSKGAGKYNVTVPHSTTYGHTHLREKEEKMQM